MIHSYRSAFVLLFAALLAVSVVAVASNGYRRATRVSLDLSADIVAQMSRKVVDRTVGLFDGVQDLLEINALIVAPGGIAEAHEALFRLFGRELALGPQIESLFVADPAGNLVAVRRSPQLVTRLIRRPPMPAGAAAAPASEQLIYRDRDFRPIAHIDGGGLFDPRTAGWYAGAGAAAGHYWSPVYRLPESGLPGITAASAVRDADGRLVAVVGADIALESLSALLAEQRLARGSETLIVAGDDRLVAYPFDLALRADAGTGEGSDAGDGAAGDGQPPRVDDLDAGWIIDAYRGYASGRARVSGNGDIEYALTDTDGTSYLAYRQAFPPALGTDWQLFTVVPTSALLSSATYLLSESVVIAVIVLVLAVLAVSWLAVRLFEPLKALVRNTERISEFRFSEVERVRSRFREVQALDGAIWRMDQALEALEKFVPADIARRLIRTGEAVEPGADTRDLAFLVSGVDALAELCDALEPEQLSKLLVEQIDAFTQLVLRRRGSIDNYLGESILAFWGAPLPADDGVERACLTALECLRAEVALYAGWDEPAAAPPRSLFAVHAGRALVGTFGSRARMTYTAIGDNVSFAWELHRLNLRYGTRLLVSDRAHDAVAERFWFRRLDRLPAEAGRRAITLFELIDDRARPLAPGLAERVRLYEQGLDALLAANWDAAEALFAGLAAQTPADGAVALMRARCQARDLGWCPGGSGLSARAAQPAAR